VLIIDVLDRGNVAKVPGPRLTGAPPGIVERDINLEERKPHALD
jgi:hypothetical protein